MHSCENWQIEGKQYLYLVHYIIIPEKELIKDNSILPIQIATIPKMGNTDVQKAINDFLPKNAKILKTQIC
jgi:hypothetical protein